MEQSKSTNKALIGIIVVVLLVAAATAVIVLSSNKPAADDSALTATDLPTDAPTTAPTNDVASSPAGTFKDGTYSAKGTYTSPGGQQSIDVKVTLANGGTVSDVSVSPHANDREAEEYQNQFVSGYKSKVVGKKISEIRLSRVAGSSLTSIGFNDAINDIEKQAQA